MAEFWVFRFFDWVKRTSWALGIVVLTCLAIGGWGFYDYYGPQFAWVGLQHWYVFPFIPDCPLFVCLFALVIIGQWLRIEHPAFTAFVAVGNIKYGVWTVFVLFYYFNLFFGGPGSEAAFRSVILLLHAGMVPLGLFLWRFLPRLKPWHVTAVFLASLTYDYFDYFYTQSYQIYPVGLPNRGVYHPYSWQELGVVPWFTIAETVLLSFALYRSMALPAADAAEPAPTPQPAPARDRM